MFVLCKYHGTEGHSEPLMALDESDVRIVLQVLAHSYDDSLVIYRVDIATGYARDWRPVDPTRRITLDDLCPKDSQ